MCAVYEESLEVSSGGRTCMMSFVGLGSIHGEYLTTL